MHIQHHRSKQDRTTMSSYPRTQTPPIIQFPRNLQNSYSSIPPQQNNFQPKYLHYTCTVPTCMRYRPTVSAHQVYFPCFSAVNPNYWMRYATFSFERRCSMHHVLCLFDRLPLRSSPSSSRDVSLCRVSGLIVARGAESTPLEAGEHSVLAGDSSAARR
jgi:hypothetical protein